MKKIQNLAVLLSFWILPVTALAQLEKTTSFFPKANGLEKAKINWYYLSVPERWEMPEAKKIKIAVAVLKCISGKATTDPILYIPGGPGEEAIGSLAYWIDNPLRKNSDIILTDIRGTGNSKPALCPDLGKKLLEIFSENQGKSQEEQKKIVAAMSCKQDLVSRGIDLSAYNSAAMAKDLNSLRKALHYDKWNVYSVSYGTYVAQVYAAAFPEDLRTLTMDSPVASISDYYNNNTRNYMNSLDKVFALCKQDEACNRMYPELEKTYYETIEQLSQKPVTVNVDPGIVASGSFTFNAEDFKIVIQQALYRKKLIEVLPLLITQFHDSNKSALSMLVPALANGLDLDYGLYYCVTCNEAIPKNSITAFDSVSSGYKRLQGGLAFYRSDFKVCEQWNKDLPLPAGKSTEDSGTLQVPTLFISGKYDPITPASDVAGLKRKYPHSVEVIDKMSGHASSFTPEGVALIGDFIREPAQVARGRELGRGEKLQLASGIAVNGGVINLANSMSAFELIFFTPLAIALLVLIVAIFSFSYSLIRNYKGNSFKLLKIITIAASVLSLLVLVGLIMGIQETAGANFYILAFGLPGKYQYLYQLQLAFLVLTLFSILLFVLGIKKVKDRSVFFSVLFSLILVNIYFAYWGFFS